MHCVYALYYETILIYCSVGFEVFTVLVLAEIFSSTLKMEAIGSSERSVATQQTTRRHIPEDDTLQYTVLLFLRIVLLNFFVNSSRWHVISQWTHRKAIVTSIYSPIVKAVLNFSELHTLSSFSPLLSYLSNENNNKDQSHQISHPFNPFPDPKICVFSVYSTMKCVSTQYYSYVHYQSKFSLCCMIEMNGLHKYE
jgi:hypothetical protein